MMQPGFAETMTSAPVASALVALRCRSAADIDRLHAFLLDLGARIVRAPQPGPWAPGYYSVLFEDPAGVRLEANFVPGKGVLAEGAGFNPADGYR